MAHTEFTIFIVDDGSLNPIRNHLKDPAIQEAIHSERIRILRNEKNRGKGFSIQRAFGEAVGLGFTHMLTLDGDGQHLGSEIEKLIATSRQFPQDLIIGKRRLEKETVPEITKFGRKFSNYWVQYQTGSPISDSQSGFRLYPLYHVQLMSFWTRRYDFEIEVLIRLIWNEIHVREIPIDVYYPPKEARVSHFNKFKDNFRISLLNIALVTLSLFKTHRSPKELGLATGLGVWIGCTPFFGLHTAMVGLFAFLLRLNAGAMWLGSQISIPPLAPILAFSSISIGNALLGKTLPLSLSDLSLELAAQSFLSWLLGSIILGAGLGSSIGGLTYLCSRRFHLMKAKGRTAWSGKTRGGKIGNGFLKWMARNFGLKTTYLCFYFVVPYFFLFAPKATKSALQYWRLIRPEIPWYFRPFYVLKHYFRFATVLLDRFYQSDSGNQYFKTRSHGFQNIIDAVHSGSGVVLLSGHAGGWDISAQYMVVKRGENPFHLVQFESQGYTYNKVLDEKTQPIEKLIVNNETQPIMNIYQLLRNGKAVALMGDRPMGSQQQWVVFFGKLALFDTSAFRIAAACRSQLLFSFAFKHSLKEYYFYATPAKYYKYHTALSKEAQCQKWAQEFAATLEDFIRKNPYQWFNFYPFWSVPVGNQQQSKTATVASSLHPIGAQT